MYSREYTKEIGLSTGVKIVPLSVAIPILGVIVGGGWFGFVQAADAARRVKAPEKFSAAVLPPGQTVATR